MRTMIYAAIASIVLSGCSSKMTVTEISPDAVAGTSVNGIPFRILKRYEAELYEKRGTKYEWIKTEPLAFTLADPHRLYVLGLEGMPFATSTLDVTFNTENNTIVQAKLVSTSKGAEAIEKAGAQLTAVTNALVAKEKLKTAEETAEANAAIAADKAFQDAEVAALEYQLLLADPNSKPLDLLKAKNKERAAKLSANELARLAGRGPYYADVVP